MADTVKHRAPPIALENLRAEIASVLAVHRLQATTFKAGHPPDVDDPVELQPGIGGKACLAIGDISTQTRKYTVEVREHRIHGLAQLGLTIAKASVSIKRPRRRKSKHGKTMHGNTLRNLRAQRIGREIGNVFRE